MLEAADARAFLYFPLLQFWLKIYKLAENQKPIGFFASVRRKAYGRDDASLSLGLSA